MTTIGSRPLYVRIARSSYTITVHVPCIFVHSAIWYRDDRNISRAARRNVDAACQRVIGNCAGLLGPLPLIASYFTESNGRPHSCLAPLIYCLTKILARTIDNRRNTVPASAENDRPPWYLGSYVAVLVSDRHAIYMLLRNARALWIIDTNIILTRKYTFRAWA